MKRMTIHLNVLRLDGDTQPRVKGIDQAVVDEYADAIDAGAFFPPLKAVHDGKTYWLYSGFHRHAAYRKAGITDVEVEVVEGTQKDAQWLSLAENQSHGLRRTNPDKRRAVQTAIKLRHKESDRAIAEHVGVDNKTVAKVRGDMESTEEIPQSSSRTGKDGRTTNTAAIGSAKKNPDPKTQPKEYAAFASSRGDSLRAIGEACGVSHVAVKKWLDDAKVNSQLTEPSTKNDPDGYFPNPDDDDRGDAWEYEGDGDDDPKPEARPGPEPMVGGDAWEVSDPIPIDEFSRNMGAAQERGDAWECDLDGEIDDFGDPTPAARESSPPEENRAMDGTISQPKPRQKPREVRETKRDALGTVLPDRLRDVFGDPAMPESLALLEEWYALLKSSESLVVRLKGRSRALPWLKYGVLIDELGAARGALSAVVACVKAGMPHAVCPTCQGQGCGDCRASGYVPDWRLEELKQQEAFLAPPEHPAA
jgi:hypothetical protein